MTRCLCCNRVIENPNEYESKVSWHQKCIKSFFGTILLPELDCSEEDLEALANTTVNKGLTVPGVQKKLSLHLDTDANVSRLTVVDYPTGFILKPQSNDFNHLPEVEYLTMKMAEACRIKTVPNALISSQGKLTYITKRIDRSKGKMYAMEDFCQLSGRMTEDKYRGSYEQCGKIIKKYSQNIGIDLAELFYRLVFCYLTGNSDMHLKNFSLIENQPGSRVFGLSEAYDLLPVNIILPADKEQVALTLNGKKRNLRKKDFFALAESCDLNEKITHGLIKQVLKYKEIFVGLINHAYIPSEMKEDYINLIIHRAETFK